jgi:Fe-S oxidoreductase
MSVAIKVIGLDMVELRDNDTCCGVGGTFAVKFDAIPAQWRSKRWLKPLPPAQNIS